MSNEEPFKPHPNLSDEINHNIAKSEVEGGVFTKDCPVGTVLSVRTKNTAYTLDRRADDWYISGHAQYCPEPTKCAIVGSTWGGSCIKIAFIGRDMHLEVALDKQGVLTTGTIQEVTEVK